MFDNVHLTELVRISKLLSRDNIGDSMIRASLLRSIIVDLEMKAKADEILKTPRDFARDADIGWKIFENPILPDSSLREVQIWQILAIAGTLLELNYCFERVEEARIFTFENSAPVRFYINSIFHYTATLFLLDAKENNKKGFHYPGTIIKVLQPIGLTDLLKPIYQILNKPFGKEMTYGDTIRQVRNKGFVHGSFSPENIEKTVKDSHIFNEMQKIRFVQNHWDMFDQIVILRLRMLSILTIENPNFEKFSPSKLFHL